VVASAPDNSYSIGMKKKLRVAVLFGGKSAEHEVSLISARNIIASLDPRTYEVILVGMTKTGQLLPPKQSEILLGASASKISRALTVTQKETGAPLGDIGAKQKDIGVVFPVLHGPFGEDGTVQGFLRLLDVPFVGAGVLGSAVGMDKDVMKRLLRDAGIPSAQFLIATRESPVSWRSATKKLGLPLFVKPANLGSSVGISKVRTKKEFERATRHAFRFDTKIILEECIHGREIECAVLGNENPKASILGEVVVHHDFYSYEAKYIDPEGATLDIPAKLSRATTQCIQNLAIKTFKTLGCEGMGRVDFFVTKKGAIYVNEINTIPGFTNISMYPKLWEASGVPYAKLVDTLIQLALQRHKKQQRLVASL